jgi:hypothetical protein
VTKPNLSRYDLSVLRFMDDKLYADGAMIGRYLCSSHGFGTKVARQMSNRGLLKWLPNVSAWRISELGRQTIVQSKQDQT